MKLYEYKIIKEEYLIERMAEVFNELGEEGWELVSIAVDKGVERFEDKNFYIFKRKK